MDIFLVKRQFGYFHGASLAATAYGQRISIERPPAMSLSFRCMTFTAVVIPALSPDIELKLFFDTACEVTKNSAKFGSYDRNCLSSGQKIEICKVKIRYDM